MATKKGTNKNDNLMGTAGNDILLGLGGNDTLDGGKGDDDLIGGDGNDTFVGRLDGLDAFNGGKGTDTVSYSKSLGGIFASIDSEGSGYVSKGGGVTDALIDVERIIGSKFSDIIGINNIKGTFAFGGKGEDAINAYGAVARGDQGNDVLYTSGSTADIVWLQRNKGYDDVYYWDNAMDKIWLDKDEFDLGEMIGYNEFRASGTGHDPVGTNAQLIWDVNASDLYYDPDGTGSAPGEIIANFVSSDPMDITDFVLV